jgi:hypothetical protein
MSPLSGLNYFIYVLDPGLRPGLLYGAPSELFKQLLRNQGQK